MRDDSRDSEVDPDRTRGEQRSDDRESGAAMGAEQMEGKRVHQGDRHEPNRKDHFGAEDLDESLAARRQEDHGDVF